MNISKEVINIIKELGGIDSVSESDNLQEDLALDSLDMVTLLLMIEDTFSIELNESDMNPYDLETVSDVIALVEKYSEVINEES